MCRGRFVERAQDSRYALNVIDTHCHLTFPDFRGREEEELTEAAAAGVTGCITISTTTLDCLAALELAKGHENVWCSAGVHPLHADEGPHEWAHLRMVAKDPKCVAWGELGLDNHYDRPEKSVQREVLADQLEFIDLCRGQGLDKPVVLHCREAFDELIPILKETQWDPAGFVFHCFTGGPRDIREILDFGAMVSFTGVVTYPNAADVRDAAKLVPIDRIMVETDSPFLAPVPNRGKRPCRPAWVRHTAQALAELRGEDWDVFHEAINANTARFFGIDVPG